MLVDIICVNTYILTKRAIKIRTDRQFVLLIKEKKICHLQLTSTRTLDLVKPFIKLTVDEPTRDRFHYGFHLTEYGFHIVKSGMRLIQAKPMSVSPRQDSSDL